MYTYGSRRKMAGRSDRPTGAVRARRRSVLNHQTRPNPYPRVGLKPLTTLFCWFSLRLFLFWLLWFSFVFLDFNLSYTNANEVNTV